MDRVGTSETVVAFGKRFWRSCNNSSGASPSRIAQTPFALCATKIEAREHSQTAKWIRNPPEGCHPPGSADSTARFGLSASEPSPILR